MVEKYKNELKEGSARSLVEYETDMNIRLQREKQATTVQKLKDMRLDVIRILIKKILMIL